MGAVEGACPPLAGPHAGREARPGADPEFSMCLQFSTLDFWGKRQVRDAAFLMCPDAGGAALLPHGGVEAAVPFWRWPRVLCCSCGLVNGCWRLSAMLFAAVQRGAVGSVWLLALCSHPASLECQTLHSTTGIATAWVTIRWGDFAAL